MKDDTIMDPRDIKAIATAEDAESYAIEWQKWSSEQNLSYGELAEWQDVLRELAQRFNLVEVFEENGII